MTHDQVEFAIYRSGAELGHQLVSQSTFQIADGNAQNIRLATATINGVNVTNILAYGDNTGTHVVEFNETSAGITGTISGNTLTVTAVSAGSLAVGDTVTGANIALNTTITGFVSGTNGGTGTYTLSTTNTVSPESITVDGGQQITSFVDPSTATFGSLTALGDGRIELTYDNTLDASGTTQYVTNIYDLRTTGQTVNNSSSITGTISGNTLTVSAVSYGALAVGQAVTGNGIAPNTTVTDLGTGTGGTGTYTLSTSNTVSSRGSVQASTTARINTSPVRSSTIHSPARTTSTTPTTLSASTIRTTLASGQPTPSTVASSGWNIAMLARRAVELQFPSGWLANRGRQILLAMIRLMPEP